MDELLRRAGDEVRDARVGDQLAAADHDQVVGGQRHLAHQVRRDEHGPALGSEPLEQVADPVDPFGIEAVDRLVEHHGLRVAEQRGRDAESLAHAERELAGALAGRRRAGRRGRSARRRGCCGMPWVCASASRWLRAERPVWIDRASSSAPTSCSGAACSRYGLPFTIDVARRRPVEPEDQPHRRRLAGAVRPEEAGDDSGPDVEGQVVDGALVAVVLGQSARFDHTGREARIL